MTYKEKYMNEHLCVDKIEELERLIHFKCPHDYYPDVEIIDKACCGLADNCEQCWGKEVEPLHMVVRKRAIMAQIARMNELNIARIEEFMKSPADQTIRDTAGSIKPEPRTYRVRGSKQRISKEEYEEMMRQKEMEMMRQKDTEMKNTEIALQVKLQGMDECLEKAEKLTDLLREIKTSEEELISRAEDQKRLMNEAKTLADELAPRLVDLELEVKC